jgi:hypothetical protein
MTHQRERMEGFKREKNNIMSVPNHSINVHHTIYHCGITIPLLNIFITPSYPKVVSQSSSSLSVIQYIHPSTAHVNNYHLPSPNPSQSHLPQSLLYTIHTTIIPNTSQQHCQYPHSLFNIITINSSTITPSHILFILINS